VYTIIQSRPRERNIQTLIVVNQGSDSNQAQFTIQVLKTGPTIPPTFSCNSEYPILKQDPTIQKISELICQYYEQHSHLALEKLNERENTYSGYSRESTCTTTGVITDCDIIELPSIGIKNWVNETNGRFTNVNALLINQCDETTNNRC
jgi:hypothetical protein